MASYEQAGKRPMAHAQPYTYQQAGAYPSYLRDPMDRFGSPGPGGYAPPTDQYRQSVYDNELPQRTKAAPPSGPWWNPKYWSKRTRIIVGILTGIIVLIIIIAAAVAGSKASSYPDYTPLNYSVADTYQGSNFYDNFEYWDTYDPAAGFVHYDNPTDAVNRNLTGYDPSTKTAYMRVDNTEEDATTGRHSARVSSRTTYDDGLFIFDISHAPYGCATWPAVWLTNQYNWPLDGEIDVVESVNQAANGNEMTLHTKKGCSMSSVKRKMTGETLGTKCYNGTNANEGCGVRGPKNTVGEAFNDNGGGVYAMELRDAGIRMWFWDHDSVPSDVTAGTAPAPHTWAQPMADFPSTDCDIGSHFKNLSIVANIDVCGQWAGRVGQYTTKNQCPGVCTTYAAQHPEAFDNSYWSFNYFKVFKAS